MIYQKDQIGAKIKPVTLAKSLQTAGAESEITSIVLNRIDFESMQLQILGEATLTDTKNLTFTTLKIEQSADGSTNWTEYIPTGVDTSLFEVVSDGGGAELFESAYNIGLAGAQEYIRVKLLVDMDAGATDTADLLINAVLGAAKHGGLLTNNYYDDHTQNIGS